MISKACVGVQLLLEFPEHRDLLRVACEHLESDYDMTSELERAGARTIPFAHALLCTRAQLGNVTSWSITCTCDVHVRVSVHVYKYT